MSNLINFVLRSTNVNGWPLVKIKSVNDEFREIKINQELTDFSVTVPLHQGNNCILLSRYNKTSNNSTQESDQILEIVNITIDGIKIPDFVLDQHSKFQFNDQIHYGSRYFSPNGIWTFEFQTPIITWVLDQQIIHESKYNQDYIYPWSYKFGPDSVQHLKNQLDSVYKIIQETL